MDAKEFRQRVSILEKGETLWRAFPDRLEKTGPDGAVRLTMPYTAVRRVRVAWAPSRGQPGRLLLELSGNTSRVTISNMHFAGLASFEDRSESFYPMLWMVALGVRRANPEAAFRAGERPEIYWPLMLFAFGALGLLATVLFSLPVSFGSVTTTPLLKGVFVLITLPVLLGWAWKSRLRAFNPDTDLEELVAIKRCAA